MPEYVNVGDVVRDKVTGFQGTATARCEYLYGKTQILVESGEKADHERWINEERLQVVSEG